MISRIVISFILGLAFVSLLDFFYFIGIKLNYFEYYNVDEYFNILFVDNQNFPLLLLASLVVGYLLLYSKFAKFFAKIYIIVVFAFASLLYAPIGKSVGKYHFMEENQRFKLGSVVFEGHKIYEGRKIIYIYRNDLEKTVKLLKEEVTRLTTL